MPSINLEVPGAGDDITSGLHATNYADLQALLNGNLDNVNLADDAVGIAELSATGSPSASTYLRGDNTWATISEREVLIHRHVVAGAALAGYDSDAVLGGVLPTIYRDIRLRCLLRGTAATASVSALMYFNGDVSASYDFAHIENSSASAAGGDAAAQTSMNVFSRVPGSTVAAGRCAVLDINVPEYRGTAFHKAVWSSGFGSIGTTSGNIIRQVRGGVWSNGPQAVTRIQINPNSGLWEIGSRFDLIGIL